MARKKPTERIVVAGTTPQEIAPLLPFARVLAGARRATIQLLGVIVVPEDESLSAGTRQAQEFRLALERLPERRDEHVLVRVTHDAWQEAREVITGEKINLMLVNWLAVFPDEIIRELPCDLVLVKGRLPQIIQHILLPIRGGPYAALALNVALSFADACDAELTLLHASPTTREKDKEVREFLRHLRGLARLTRTLRVRREAVEAILEQARPSEHQLLVMGANARPRREETLIGPTAQRIVDAVDIPALIVKSRRVASEMNGDVVPPIDYTISVVVDKWFAENTFHAHEFEDIKQLVEEKEKQGLRISLGLPTLNEQDTIGGVIAAMQKRFVREYALLDEIVVIDSDSTDRTVEIAEGLGVPVVKHPNVLTQYGVGVGKGQALWSSLYVLNGDLIAWIDTDIVNIHPRFVYGILGPLIRQPHLVYVKGFYQRPLKIGGKMQARGGGRVTELVARPLFNLFYPELSGFIQPLAGEYAGRRSALEEVPFYIGYGVETGLLIDLLNKYGLSAMGQVDLEERVHRNQSLEALSKMAFEIVQVVMARVGEERGVELVDELNKSMKLIRYQTDAFQLDVAEIRARHRPPMITIPEYRSKRGLEPLKSR